MILQCITIEGIAGPYSLSHLRLSALSSEFICDEIFPLPDLKQPSWKPSQLPDSWFPILPAFLNQKSSLTIRTFVLSFKQESETKASLKVKSFGTLSFSPFAFRFPEPYQPAQLHHAVHIDTLKGDACLTCLPVYPGCLYTGFNLVVIHLSPFAWFHLVAAKRQELIAGGCFGTEVQPPGGCSSETTGCF
jgi:hypothetical protein